MDVDVKGEDSQAPVIEPTIEDDGIEFVSMSIGTGRPRKRKSSDAARSDADPDSDPVKKEQDVETVPKGAAVKSAKKRKTSKVNSNDESDPVDAASDEEDDSEHTPKQMQEYERM